MVFEKNQTNTNMKKIFLWIITLLILFGVLLVRLIPRYFSSNKQIFKDKKITGLEFKDIKIDYKDDNNWVVVKSSKVYQSDFKKVNELIESLKNFQILELVSKNKNTYKDFMLDEETSKKIKVFTSKGKKISETTIFLGKQGGFSYNELYVRINNNSEVYLAKGIDSWLFEQPFYNFCDKRVLDLDIEYIESFEILSDKKIEYKKELKDGTTTWFKNGKLVESEKVQEFLKKFENLVADCIIDELQLEKLKVSFRVKLKYKNNTEVIVDIYNKDVLPPQFSSYYPLRIRCSNKESQDIKFCGNEEIFFGIYEYKYNNLSKITK